MTVATFSVATTGYRPGNPFAVKTLIMSDISDAGLTVAGPFSCQQGCMESQDSFLVKRQDGSLRRYRIDAERSFPGYIVLLPL